MARRRLRLSPEAVIGRRAATLGLAALAAGLALPRTARAFGPAGTFHPRMLSVGGVRFSGVRDTAPARWAYEVMRRTSAPARLTSSVVAADQSALFAEPFLIWAGDGEVPRLSASELRGLARYLRLGGMLIVDDSHPESGEFGRSARRELMRVLPQATPVKLDPGHVVYKTYYILDRPVGRVQGDAQIEAIVRGGNAQVLLLSHDLLGALARTRSGGWALEAEPGGARQREYAARFAVNIAMYLLCSDYKDDQVHAPWLMRRRARVRR